MVAVNNNYDSCIATSSTGIIIAIILYNSASINENGSRVRMVAEVYKSEVRLYNYIAWYNSDSTGSCV